MPSAGNRSKKVAAKAAQRKAVVAEKKRVERVATSLPARVALAAHGPVHRCSRSVTLLAMGLGYVVLSRRLPSNVIANAIFLVDTFCLGVKNVMYKESSPSDFEDLVESLGGEEGLVDMDPSAARKLLREAVAYTADFGIPPNKDYAAVEKLFGDADSHRSTEHFVFGENGKPLYVQGPSDKPERVREVTRALTARFGAEGWHMVRKSDLFPLVDDDLNDDEFMASDQEGSDTGVLDDVDYRRIESTSEAAPDK